MTDLERLAINMHAMDDIVFADITKDAQTANPDYPEEYFWKLHGGRRSPFYVNARDMTGFSKQAPLSVAEQGTTRDLAVCALYQLLDKFGSYDHIWAAASYDSYGKYGCASDRRFGPMG